MNDVRREDGISVSEIEGKSRRRRRKNENVISMDGYGEVNYLLMFSIIISCCCFYAAILPITLSEVRTDDGRREMDGGVAPNKVHALNFITKVSTYASPYSYLTQVLSWNLFN